MIDGPVTLSPPRRSDTKTTKLPPLKKENAEKNTHKKSKKRRKKKTVKEKIHD